MIVLDIVVISDPAAASPTNQNFYNKQKSSKVSRTEDTLLFPISPRVSETGRGRVAVVKTAWQLWDFVWTLVTIARQ